MRIRDPFIWLASIPVVAVVAIFVALLLTGCASDWQAMNCPDGVDMSLVKWERTVTANAECRKLGMDENVMACAQCVMVGGVSTMCVIISKPDVEDRFLGHELRHAFGCSHEG